MLLLLIFLVINIITGSSSLTLSQVIAVLTSQSPEQIPYLIVWQIRLPRALAAILLDGALSVAGFLLQSFFRNPIAGPFVLGISSGAKLAVASIMIFCLQSHIVLSSGMMILASWIGSLLVMGFVLLAAGKVQDMSFLVVIGIMIGYICSAVTDILVAFADDSNIVNLHNWSMGTFSGTNWADIKIMSIVIIAALLCTVLLSKPMSAYQLGETYAKNAGVNIRMLRIAFILLSSMLAACVTAFAGTVSFVGIAVPHLMKKLFGTAKPLLLLPACFLGGAVFCLFCDGLARNLFAPTELSISTVTAVFGSPIVIHILLQRQKGKYL